MPILRNSILIEAPLACAFEVSNRLEEWPKMMEDYKKVEILRQEGLKVWFRLTHATAGSWTSWRVISPERKFALAERHEPRGIFDFMQHFWIYRETGVEQTEMTWEMNYEVAEPHRDKEEAVRDHMQSSIEKNQASMRAFINDVYRSGSRSNGPAAAEPRLSSEIRANNGLLTFINIFHVEPANEEMLLRRLEAATQEVMCKLPGFISANVHRNIDGGTVINYVQWENREAFDAMRQNPAAIAHMESMRGLSRSERGFYDVIAVYRAQPREGV